MLKVALAMISQETCSFNPTKTTLQNFKDTELKTDNEVAEALPHEGVIGGFINVMKHEDCELVGLLSCKAMAGGELSGRTFSELKSMFLTRLRKVGRLDALFIALHGAMVADEEFDTEGALIAEAREVVGKDCFIVVELDHHANVTRKMLDTADVMVGYETQPHKLPESGEKAARVLLDIWRNRRKPQAALVKIPMLAPQDNFLTSDGPMKEWFDMAREIENDEDVIVASPFPTQPWLDVPDNGWSCLVYADTKEKAQAYAETLAQKAWDLRERFWRSERLSLAETIATANAEPKGLVVISDTGDAAFGGGPGDNMSLAVEMMKGVLSGPALVPAVDPEAFTLALKAGIGNEVALSVGGKMSAGYFPCLQIKGTVKAMSPAGHFELGDGRSAANGRSVLVENGNLKLAILESRDYSINHPSLYENLGIDVGKAKMVVLKTGSNFQYFKQYQSRLLRADSPGATQSDLTAFKWRNMNNPTYPFVDIKDWRGKS